MKLSQPSSAREINKYRVLNLLKRKSDLSKAEIARRLSLNKVSTGEIVNSLIEDGLVIEGDKIDSSNGRKPTSLKIDTKAKFVIAIDIGPRNTTIALFDLGSEMIKLERIPNRIDQTPENFCVDIIKSCLRTLRPVGKDKILGIGVTCQGTISDDKLSILETSYLPWRDVQIGKALKKMLNIPVVVKNSLESLVLAEAQKTGMFEIETLYIDWGDRINSILVRNGIFFGSESSLGHLKVSEDGLCFCGSIGCLETKLSAWALSKEADIRLRNLWCEIDYQKIRYLIDALNLTRTITGCKQIILGGEGSTIPEDKLKYIQDNTSVPVNRSVLGDKANIISAAEAAYDEFLFQSRLLSEVGYLI